MVDAWIILTRLTADLLAMAGRPANLGWMAVKAGAAWTSWIDLAILPISARPAAASSVRDNGLPLVHGVPDGSIYPYPDC
jgi:hypothetical protein